MASCVKCNKKFKYPYLLKRHLQNVRKCDEAPAIPSPINKYPSPFPPKTTSIPPSKKPSSPSNSSTSASTYKYISNIIKKIIETDATTAVDEHNNIYFHLASYLHPDVSHITEKEIIKLLKKHKSIPHEINKKILQNKGNHNVIASHRSKKAKIYDGKEWKTKNTEDVVNNRITFLADYISTIIEEHPHVIAAEDKKIYCDDGNTIADVVEELNKSDAERDKYYYYSILDTFTDITNEGKKRYKDYLYREKLADAIGGKLKTYRQKDNYYIDYTDELNRYDTDNGIGANTNIKLNEKVDNSGMNPPEDINESTNHNQKHKINIADVDSIDKFNNIDNINTLPSINAF